MRLKVAVVALTLLSACSSNPPPQVACFPEQDPAGGEVVERVTAKLLSQTFKGMIEEQYIVQFKESAPGEAAGLFASQLAEGENPFTVAEAFLSQFAGVRLLRVLEGKIVVNASAAQAAEMLARPNVKRVVADRAVKLIDPVSTTLDGPEAEAVEGDLDRMDGNKDGAYNAGPGSNLGAGTLYVSVDTGINTSHDEFSGEGKILELHGLNGGEDDHGHGTHTSSQAVGNTFGGAPRGNVAACKFLTASGSGSLSDALGCIEWATSLSTKYPDLKINQGHSWGGSGSGGAAELIAEALGKAWEAGQTFTVAAGNESQDANNSTPASAECAITVAASDHRDDTFAPFSNYGTGVDSIAPGVSTRGAWIGGSGATNVISGTSMAQPREAGVVLKEWSDHPDFTNEQIVQFLRDTAEHDTIRLIPEEGTPNVFWKVTPVP